MSVIPRSTAERIVSIDSSWSEFPPHIQPPIAQVPSAMREATIPDVPISIVSILFAAGGSPLALEDGVMLLSEEISNAMNTLLDERPPNCVPQASRRRM